MNLLFILNLILAFLFLPGSFAGGCYSAQVGSPNRNTASTTQTSQQQQPQQPQSLCLHYNLPRTTILDNGDRIYYDINTDPERGNQLGRGGSGGVYHAYSTNRNKCVALKIKGRGDGEREVQLLEHFARLNQTERNRIIGYYGHKHFEGRDRRTYIVLELGDNSLLEYYQANTQQGEHNLPLLIKLLESAARALAQFNEYAVHFDVKQNNFVVVQDSAEDYMDFTVKIIDLQFSVLLSNPIAIRPDLLDILHKPRELRGNGQINLSSENIRSYLKSDIYAFGVMGFLMLNHNNGEIRRIKDRLSVISIRNDDGSRLVQFENERQGLINNFNNLINNYRNTQNPNQNDLDRIIKRCLQSLPPRRPGINQVVQALNAIDINEE